MSMDPQDIRATLAPFLKVVAALQQIDQHAEALLIARGESINVKKQRDKLQAEHDALAAKHAALGAQHADLLKQVGQVRSELEAEHQHVQAVAVERKKMEQSILAAKAGLQAQLDQMRAKHDRTMDEDKAGWAKSLGRLEAERDKLESEVTQAKAKHAAFVASLTSVSR